uniref:Cytochrome P450 n=1 Tax=Timema tahoe TaxID=61484 RepID=A0A7R9IQE9_9NEOP|nr:unnamed protein product [Timema tahoe]
MRTYRSEISIKFSKQLNLQKMAASRRSTHFPLIHNDLGVIALTLEEDDEGVLSKTLRKYHPDVMLNRVCSKSYTIPGTEVRIERGTQVIIPVYALNHDPQYFPDPESFYPERFDPENKSSSDLLDFLPFGIGSRKCIGMDYAMIQMKVGLASLISKFKFGLYDEATTPIELDSVTFNLRAKKLQMFTVRYI